MDIPKRYTCPHPTLGVIVGYRITWRMVTPGENEDDAPTVESGWYQSGGWYFAADDETASQPTFFENDECWADILAEYGAEHEGQTAWAHAHKFDEDLTTGAVTCLYIHPVTGREAADA